MSGTPAFAFNFADPAAEQPVDDEGEGRSENEEGGSEEDEFEQEEEFINFEPAQEVQFRRPVGRGTYVFVAR